MKKVDFGHVYMIPTHLGFFDKEWFAPAAIDQIHKLQYFLAERPKTTRLFLKEIGHPSIQSEINVSPFDNDTPETLIAEYLQLVLEGIDLGVISEAGCPGVADPGQNVVKVCHKLGIRVIPWPGPSSILLALMASGLNGQQFAFCGYLPAKKDILKPFIQKVVAKCNKGETQIFIETPYRNDSLLESLLSELPSNLTLCIARGIMTPDERIKSYTIKEWKEMPKQELGKTPTIFLLGH